MSEATGQIPAAARDVTVAIVSHRHARFLDACLSTLLGGTRRVTLDVTLVDNVGEPEIPALLAQRFPQVRLIVNSRPMGFAANNNQVILGCRSRYAFLLNPDTEMRPGAVDALVEFMDARPAVGACGPKLLYPDGRLQLSCRRFPTLGSFLVRRTPLRLLWGGSATARRYEMTDWTHEHPGPVDWLFGAAILIRREALEAVGGLDEKMFLYSEDVDWCLRCRQAGWDIWYVPQAVFVHHLDDAKYNGYFSRHRWLHYRTMARYVRKHWRSCLRW